MKMAVQYWLNRGVRTRSASSSPSRAAITATPPARWRSAIPRPACTALFRGLAARASSSSTCRRTRRAPTSLRARARTSRRRDRRASSSSRWCRARAACASTTPDVLRRLREAADRYELLLDLRRDLHRLRPHRHLFACEAAGVVPDIITLSKALTGGTLPLAATVARRHVFDAFWSDDPLHALMHGPTYMANALACAAANASLDLFEREPRLAAGGRDRAGARRAGLRPAAACRASRTCASRAPSAWSSSSGSTISTRLRARFVDEGVFIRPFGSIVYLTPAFTIGEEELATLTGAIVKVLQPARVEIRTRPRSRADRRRPRARS